MKSFRSLLLATILLCCAAITGCQNDPTYPEKSITVKISGLPQLDSGACYQLWISYPASSAHGKGATPNHGDAEYFSTGTFRIDATGAPVALDGVTPATFKIPAGYNANLIIDAVVSIENTSFGAATAPGARLLGGEFAGTATQGKATLELTGDDTFGYLLTAGSIDTAFTGSYILDAPTGGDSSLYARGIWFVNDANGTSAGLKLPSLPIVAENSRWMYQAWVMRSVSGTTEYLPLGKFTDPKVADDDGAGSLAGGNASAAYTFPGQDFVAATPQRILNDGTYSVMVSLQPTTVTLSKPFLLLLQHSPIPLALNRKQPTVMGHNHPVYSVEVTVDR